MDRSNFFKCLYAFLGLTLLIYGCKSGLCDNIKCEYENQACINGLCACIPGYEGAKCDTISALKMIGSYRVNGTCTPYEYVSQINTLASTKEDVSDITFSNFLNLGVDVIGYVDNTQITVTNQKNYNIEALGYYNPNNRRITLNINYYDIASSTQKTCTMTYHP